MNGPNWTAFHINHNGRANVLRSEVYLQPAAAIAGTNGIPAYQKFVAIWDTGATHTLITENVAKALNLKAIGQGLSIGVHGQENRDRFIVDVMLPNRLQIQNVEVTSAANLSGGDVLIGMDIIGAGDFAVCNEGGKTSFSFRFPPGSRIDFVAQHSKEMQQMQASAGYAANAAGGASKRRSARRK